MLREIEKSGNLRKQVYERIKKAIITHRLYPGMKLDEKELSEMLGVSRTPIREAFVRLDQEGLILVKPNRGVFVNRITVLDLIEVLQMREVLEGLASYLFAKNAGAAEVERLEEIMAPFTFENIDQSIEEYNLANVDFHNIITRGSKNERLMATINNLYDHLSMATVLQVISVTGRGRRSLEEHQGLIEAIKNREGRRAEKICREHIASLRTDIVDNLEKFNTTIPNIPFE